MPRSSSEMGPRANSRHVRLARRISVNSGGTVAALGSGIADAPRIFFTNWRRFRLDAARNSCGHVSVAKPNVTSSVVKEAGGWIPRLPRLHRVFSLRRYPLDLKQGALYQEADDRLQHFRWRRGHGTLQIGRGAPRFEPGQDFNDERRGIGLSTGGEVDKDQTPIAPEGHEVRGASGEGVFTWHVDVRWPRTFCACFEVRPWTCSATTQTWS